MFSPTVLCQVRSCLGVMALALTQGLAIGWASPGTDKLMSGQAGFRPDTDAVSWIVSVYDLGATLGTCGSVLVFALIGRRQTVLMGSVSLTVWCLMSYFATGSAMLIAARVFAGFGMGIALSFSFIYVGEVASSTVRGPLILAVVLLLPTGQLLTFIVSPLVSWEVMCLYPLPFVVVMVLAMWFLMVESPFFYAMKDNDEAMKKSLRALRVGLSEEDILEEAAHIRTAVQQQREAVANWSKMFAPPGAKKAAGIVLVESSSLALLGVTCVLSYTKQIFDGSGSDIVRTDVASIIVMCLAVIMVVVAIVLIERLGRRLQLSLSAFLSAAAMLCLSIYFYAKDSGADMAPWNWAPLVLLLMFIAAMGAGLNAVPQVLMSELLDERAKAVIAPVSISIMSLTSFGINNVFLRVGFWSAFLFFACYNLFIALFTLIVVPETKGKTLMEIQDMLRGKKVRKEII